MKTKALLKLADYLEKTNFKKTKKGFSLGIWSCETTACAIGHAVIAGIAPKGLELISWSDGATYTPTYKEGLASPAVGEAYGITPDQAEYLFYPHAYQGKRTSPKTVARRIRKFVEAA